MQTLVLASGSGYEIFEKLHLGFVTCNSNVDESVMPTEVVHALAIRLSVAKASIKVFPKNLIIGSHQVAVCYERQIGKPGAYEKQY